MIGHYAIDTDTHGLDFERLDQHSFEGGVIIVVIEQTHSADATIQHMEHHSTGSNSRGSRHQDMLRETKHPVNKCACPLFFAPSPDPACAGHDPMKRRSRPCHPGPIPRRRNRNRSVAAPTPVLSRQAAACVARRESRRRRRVALAFEACTLCVAYCSAGYPHAHHLLLATGPGSSELTPYEPAAKLDEAALANARMGVRREPETGAMQGTPRSLK